MISDTEVLDSLKILGNPELVEKRAKQFGIHFKNALGITMKDLNLIAKEIGKNEKLAIELFNSNFYEAKILCSKIFPPKNLTKELAEKWVKEFNNWEFCDSFSMQVFSRSNIALELINRWTSRTAEFEKRAAFATLASYCTADKQANNRIYEHFYPILEQESMDGRTYVKKAISWALRSIGKRNIDLKHSAIKCAKRIASKNNPSSQWIAKDVLRELQSDSVRLSDYPRELYRISKPKN